ncbi:hypothetical protein [Bradyrhizobium elkanii]|uniref:hypothetical protein n=1 Tax=Bradyrhizobium elkanii TaxID=29448 RepID=UPI003D1A6F9E
MPTRVLTAAPSLTALAVALPSVGVEGGALLTAIVKLCDETKIPSVACTLTT